MKFEFELSNSDWGWVLVLLMFTSVVLGLASNHLLKQADPKLGSRPEPPINDGTIAWLIAMLSDVRTLATTAWSPGTWSVRALALVAWLFEMAMILWVALPIPLIVLWAAIYALSRLV